jgi:hypothetical protein
MIIFGFQAVNCSFLTRPDQGCTGSTLGPGMSEVLHQSVCRHRAEAGIAPPKRIGIMGGLRGLHDDGWADRVPRFVCRRVYFTSSTSKRSLHTASRGWRRSPRASMGIRIPRLNYCASYPQFTSQTGDRADPCAPQRQRYQCARGQGGASGPIS